MTTRTRFVRTSSALAAMTLAVPLLAGAAAAANAPAAAGDPDPAFGDHGFVDVLSPDLDWPTVRDVSGNPKRDGGAVFAGTLTQDSSFFSRPYAAKLLPDGSYDDEFGVGGVVYPTLPGWPDEEFQKYADEALPHTGGVLVAGNAGDKQAGWRTRLWLEKFGRHGRVERDFAQNGRFRVRNLDFSFNRDVNIAADDSIIICGTSPRSTKLTVIRLDANGMAIPGFGTDGRASLATKDHGAVASCAVSDAGVVTVLTREPRDFWLTRLTPTGELDTAFGRDGVVRQTLVFPDNPVGGVVKPDGSAVILVSSGEQVSVMKRRPNGALDTSYGTGGSATVEFGDDEISPYGYEIDTGAAGTVVVLGRIAGRVVGGEPYVARLLSDGAMDPAFGAAGVSNLVEVIDDAWEVDAYPDGRVLVEGYAFEGGAHTFARLLD